MIGALIADRYQLESELGRGGMGVVYRAHDTLLKRDVAVKVLTKTELGTEGWARLLTEAQAVAQLSHPNIVTVFDAGEADGVPYIVMELVKGLSLHERQPEGLEEIVAVAKQVCMALGHAHEKGIVHRDLKPENVLLGLEGTAKLMDFGLARSVASRLTAEGVITGTVFYMAPELALGQRYDGRADLYALGVMLYELVTGELPFSAGDPIAVISQHLHAPAVPPLAKNEALPPYLNDLILRLLSKSPEDRPATASKVLAALEAGDRAEPEVRAKELSVLDRIVRGRLVGREQEIKTAREMWNRATAGEGQLLLISGEPGIGKTRLVRELATTAEVTGGKAFVGASYAEGGSPYAPFRSILPEAVHFLGDAASNLPGEAWSGLAALAPELRLDFPDLARDDVDEVVDRSRLFGHVSLLFAALSRRAPLLLVFDDVHWSDSGTLHLLRHLARDARRRPVMIVATHREVELEQAQTLHQVLLAFERERLGTRLKLMRLDREATERLLATIFAEEITPEFLEGIYRETEGNPFFVEEVCKALVESGKLTFEDGRWHRPDMAELGVPQSLKVAIQSRVMALPAEAQETLVQAAFLGRTFDFATLREATDTDVETLLGALEEAEYAQLIEAQNGADSQRFTFAHALIPATLVEDVRILQRRRLHRRAAMAIGKHDPERYEALAHHLVEAGELDRGVAYLLRAGDRARLLCAHEEAIDSYRQGLEYAQEQGDLAQAARILMKLGLTYHTTFQHAEARQAYQEGFALWQRAEALGPAAPPWPAPHPLRLAVGEPKTLDPALTWDFKSARIIGQLFSGLVTFSPELDVLPDLAHSWQVLEGGRRYTFHLREDATWSDGRPVTAHDVEYSWKRLLDPATGAGAEGAYILYEVKGARPYHQGEANDAEAVGVRALDEWTLQVELERPSAYFLQLLAYCVTWPVPRWTVEAHGQRWTEPENIVTNGPFRLTAWEPGRNMTLERSPAYHGRFSGNVETVELLLRFEERFPEALARYEAGKLEQLILSQLEPAEFNRLRYRYAEEYFTAPALITVYLAFDCRRPPFHDPRVRRAFTLAIDREHFFEVVQGGFYLPVTAGFVPPGMPGHVEGIALPYDPEQARGLLAESGYPGGDDFPDVAFLCVNNPFHLSTTAFLGQQWLESLGVRIAWHGRPWPDFLDRVASEDDRSHFWLNSWVGGPDPDHFLRLPDFSGITGWENRAFTKLIDEARGLTDQPERMTLYEEAERILVNQAPVTPLAYGRFHALLKPWVKRFPTSPIQDWFWKDVLLEPHD